MIVFVSVLRLPSQHAGRFSYFLARRRAIFSSRVSFNFANFLGFSFSSSDELHKLQVIYVKQRRTQESCITRKTRKPADHRSAALLWTVYRPIQTVRCLSLLEHRPSPYEAEDSFLRAHESSHTRVWPHLSRLSRFSFLLSRPMVADAVSCRHLVLPRPQSSTGTCAPAQPWDYAVSVPQLQIACRQPGLKPQHVF